MSLTTARKPLNLAIFCLMVFLCVIWGAQQVALKYTVPDMPPVTQLAFRFCGAAFVFLVLMLKSEGRHAFADGNVRSGLFVGALFAVEFLLLAESLKYTTAAHSVVFLYTAPVFAALGLHVFPEERLSLVQWLGIAVAVLGIAVAFFDGSEPKTASMLLGDGLALSGGMMWGASTVALRRSKLASVSATKAVFIRS